MDRTTLLVVTALLGVGQGGGFLLNSEGEAAIQNQAEVCGGTVAILGTTIDQNVVAIREGQTIASAALDALDEAEDRGESLTRKIEVQRDRIETLRHQLEMERRANASCAAGSTDTD